MMMSHRAVVFNIIKRFSHFPKMGYSTKEILILGIETSCDDTGCAVVDSEGIILGEALHSQHLTHLRNGGIIPPVAQTLHREYIENVVHTAMERANIKFNDLSAIATTVKPGLPLSLIIGLKYGKYLCQVHKKPLIPIHHMEAHALTARMHDKTVKFPFLVLLVSGGHCLLAVAQQVDKFLLLGTTRDDAPGEAFDKTSRRMKLRNLPEFSQLSGGEAIEMAAAKATNPSQFPLTAPLLQYKDCNFSMAGLKAQAVRHIWAEEKKHELPPDGIIPDVYNLCASFQLTLARHLCHRVQRGMIFARRKNLIPQNQQTLVVSGGVACNNFIAQSLQTVCDDMDYKFVRPPAKLCTDNGVMIAWNGVEKWKENVDVLEDFVDVEIEKSCPLGESLINEVIGESISCKWTKLTDLVNLEKQNSVSV